MCRIHCASPYKQNKADDAIKMKIFHVGKWSNYRNKTGEMSQMLKCVAIPKSGQPTFLRAYGCQEQFEGKLQANKSIKLVNFMKKDNHIVCTVHSRIYS